MSGDEAVDVRFSEAAAEQVSQIKAKGEAKPDSQHGTLWRGIEHALKVLAQRRFAIAVPQLKGLAPVRRTKFGRSRLFLLYSDEKRVAVLLFIGY